MLLLWCPLQSSITSLHSTHIQVPLTRGKSLCPLKSEVQSLSGHLLSVATVSKPDGLPTI